MVRRSLIFFIFLITTLTAQISTDIYTVQQDQSYIDKIVTVTGIVTVSQNIYHSNKIFLEDSKGGVYSGIAIFNEKTEVNVQLGDEVKVTGKVIDNHGMTEIQIQKFSIISRNNPLPPAEVVKTSELATNSSTAESYKGVLVKVINVGVINDNLGYGEWLVDDGSGGCRIDDGGKFVFYNVENKGTKISSITGILKYNYGNFKIVPRFRSDIVKDEKNKVFNIYNIHQDNSLLGKNISLSGVVTGDSENFKSGEIIISEPNGGPLSAIPLYLNKITDKVNIGDKIQIQGKVHKEKGLTKIDVNNLEIISSGNQLPGAIFPKTGDFTKIKYKPELYNGVLCKFFNVKVTNNSLGNGKILIDDGSGECPVRLNSAIDIPEPETRFLSITGIINFNNDGIELQICNASDINKNSIPAVGDTLTVIQRPILNVPEIVKVGDILNIECTASPKASSWKVELRLGKIQIPLKVKKTQYDHQNQIWNIATKIPKVPVFDLYDLVISASDEISDRARNAVKVISNYKDDYYFVHITDPHLPTHMFWYETGSFADSSEMVDLREVINDINIINPEFVLLTGDLINEGELEDFQFRRYYSRSKRLLGEFEVPVFLTSGNHDLGGWSSTPPPDGTARHLWWKFFGWKRLYNPPGENPIYSQNYSFDYGPVHYVGLEAYKNYDKWKSDIYGKNSFTSRQIEWLKSDLIKASQSISQVLFYHYDFKEELNLEELGVEMTLWGHTHRDAGDVNGKTPFNISTKSVCDGNRAYRLVRVSNGVLTPSETISAGQNGNNLNVKFQPANDGTHSSVTAMIENSINEQFEHSIIRFNMPKSRKKAKVIGGELEQIDNSGKYSIYYVKVKINSKSSQTVQVSF